ncbi:MAG: DNA polymerase III subunit beta [Parcubacteria group bacterium]
MKLICTQENFKKAIFNSERVVAKQTTLPILNNILIEADKKGLSFSATNLEMGAVVNIGAKVEKEGKITLPAKLLSNFVNNLLLGENIEIEGHDQALKIKSGGSKALIKGLPATDFPLIPKKKSEPQLQIEGEKMALIIKKVVSAVALNETRQELTGVNVLFGEKELFFAATDSFRLTEYRLAISEKNRNKELYQALISKKESVIIPAVTLLEVGRIITEDDTIVKITIEEGQVFFEVNGTTLVSRLINGKYPDYKHIMPKDFKTRMVGEKSGLQGAIKMASIFASGKTSEIRLKTDQRKKIISIEARSVEIGENVSELKLDITGEDQDIVFNSRYLLDGISTIETSQVAILANSGTAPVALKEIDEKTGEVLEDYIYIVMPIKN